MALPAVATSSSPTTARRCGSRTDHLTGLFNRRHLDEQLTAIASSSRRHAYPVAVLLADVDHVKRVNDVHGHVVGDEVLVEVARCFTDAVRTEDVVGRWGGEELLVLLPHTGLDGARALAERLRAVVAASPVQGPAGPVPVTVSIGGGVAQVPGAGVEPLLRRADEGLYAAKAAGRDRVVVTALDVV